MYIITSAKAYVSDVISSHQQRPLKPKRVSPGISNVVSLKELSGTTRKVNY